MTHTSMVKKWMQVCGRVAEVCMRESEDESFLLLTPIRYAQQFEFVSLVEGSNQSFHVISVNIRYDWIIRRHCWFESEWFDSFHHYDERDVGERSVEWFLRERKIYCENFRNIFERIEKRNNEEKEDLRGKSIEERRGKKELTNDFKTDDSVDGSSLFKINSTTIITSIRQSNRINVQKCWPIVQVKVCTSCRFKIQVSSLDTFVR